MKYDLQMKFTRTTNEKFLDEELIYETPSKLCNGWGVESVWWLAIHHRGEENFIKQ